MRYSGTDVVLVVDPLYTDTKTQNEDTAFVLPITSAYVSGGMNTPLTLSVRLQYVPGVIALMPGMHVSLLQGETGKNLSNWRHFPVIADGVIQSLTTRFEDRQISPGSSPTVEISIVDPIYQALQHPIFFFSSSVSAESSMPLLTRLISSGHKLNTGKMTENGEKTDDWTLSIAAMKALAGYLQNFVTYAKYLSTVLADQKGNKHTAYGTIQLVIDLTVQIAKHLHWELDRVDSLYNLQQQLICAVPGNIAASWHTLLKMNSSSINAQLSNFFSKKQEGTLLEIIQTILHFYSLYFVSQPLPMVMSNKVPSYMETSEKLYTEITKTIDNILNKGITDKPKIHDLLDDKDVKTKTTEDTVYSRKQYPYVGKYMFYPAGSIKPLVIENDIPLSEVLEYNTETINTPPTRYLLTVPLSPAGDASTSIYVQPYLQNTDNGYAARYAKYTLPLHLTDKNSNTTNNIIWSMDANNTTYLDLIKKSKDLSPVEWGTGIHLQTVNIQTKTLGFYYSLYLETLLGKTKKAEVDTTIRKYLTKLEKAKKAEEVNAVQESLKKELSTMSITISPLLFAQWWFQEIIDASKLTHPSNTMIQIKYHPEIRVGLPIRIQYMSNVYILGTVAQVQHNINPNGVSYTTVVLTPQTEYISGTLEEIETQTLDYLTRLRTVWDLYVTTVVLGSKSTEYNKITPDAKTFIDNWMSFALVKDDKHSKLRAFANRERIRNALKPYLQRFAENLSQGSAVPATDTAVVVEYATIEHLAKHFTDKDFKDTKNALYNWLSITRNRLESITVPYAEQSNIRIFASTPHSQKVMWNTIQQTHTYLVGGGRIFKEDK